MPKERNRTPFESFGTDMKQARKALGFSQKKLAELVNIDPRYLANIENIGALPSLPVFYEIVHICKLPIERYFHPAIEANKPSVERERAQLKLSICPERYLSIVEGAIDAAIRLEESADKTKEE